ncbi:hypothetical protein FI667_g9582, partial [Globisporangium splendens]
MDNFQDTGQGFDDESALVPSAESNENQIALGELLEWINCDVNGLNDILSSDTTGIKDSTSPTTSNAPRKRTYEMRKEEKDMLNKEVSYLGAKLDYLKHRAGIPDAQTISQSKLEKALLREILRNQQYLAAGFKSKMSADTSEHVRSPLAASLHLGTGPHQRQQLLNEIRPQQILHAKRFIEARTQFINPTMRFSESSRFHAENGDNYAAKIDVIPLPHATSVKQVYDTILFHLLNVDISLAEKMLETVTLREKQDSGDGFASQHRVLCTNHGIDVEINSGIFSQFTPSPPASPSSGIESDSGGECIVTTTFIECDDLYPYRSREYVRQDITSVWMVTRYPANGITNAIGDRQSSLQDDSAIFGPAAAKQVIVLKRWAQTKLHHSKIDIPEDKLSELTEDPLWLTNTVIGAVCASFQSTLSQ